MLGNILGALISGGASLIGGAMSSKATKEANKAQVDNAALDRAMQVQFAKEGVRWKVDDAKAAGIHPLYALGANTVSYSPSAVGQIADTNMGTAFASAGQDLGRAINATRTQPERDEAFVKTARDMSLVKMGLENELLGAQIAKLRQTPNPPFPFVGDLPLGEMEPRSRLMLGGKEIQTDPGMSDAQVYENRYGELADWLAGPYIMWRDFQHNRGKNPLPSPEIRRGWLDALTGRR